jgi:hypothetical protein
MVGLHDVRKVGRVDHASRLENGPHSQRVSEVRILYLPLNFLHPAPFDLCPFKRGRNHHRSLYFSLAPNQVRIYEFS